MQSEERDSLIDIIRFISILSVVIGHAFNTDIFYDDITDTIRKFVYTYHLAIFFWCSGFVYKRKPIRKVLKGMIHKQYLRTTIIALCSFGLIPILNQLDVIKNISLESIILRIIKVIIYLPYSGILTGSLWFMPFFTVSLILFESLIRFIKDDKKQLAFAVVFGVCGLIFVNYDIFSFYYFNLALLMQPIIVFGYFTKKYNLRYYNEIKSWNWIIVLAIILVMNYITNYEIELSKNLTYEAIFYLVFFLGLIFCISLSKNLSKFRYKKIFTLIGSHTFEIMAFHIVVFKVFDGILFKISNEPIDVVPTAYPISYSSVGVRILYVIVGMVVPLLVCKCMNLLKSKLFLIKI